MLPYPARLGRSGRLGVLKSFETTCVSNTEVVCVPEVVCVKKNSNIGYARGFCFTILFRYATDSNTMDSILGWQTKSEPS